MERIAILAALRWECRPILRQMRSVQRVRVGAFTAWRSASSGHELCLVQTGIGEQRAAAAATALSAADRFDLLIATGCAGALATDLLPGDLVVATKVLSAQSDPPIATDAQHTERLRQAATRAGLRTRVGNVLCSPHVLASVAAKRAAAAETGAIAVDMEGAGVAAAARAAGVPFASVRAVLDTAEAELRESGDFLDPQSGTLKPLALARHLVAHPTAIAHLLAFNPMMRAAETALGSLFAALFQQAGEDAIDRNTPCGE